MKAIDHLWCDRVWQKLLEYFCASVTDSSLFHLHFNSIHLFLFIIYSFHFVIVNEISPVKMLFWWGSSISTTTITKQSKMRGSHTATQKTLNDEVNKKEKKQTRKKKFIWLLTRIVIAAAIDRRLMSNSWRRFSLAKMIFFLSKKFVCEYSMRCKHCYDRS